MCIDTDPEQYTITKLLVIDIIAEEIPQQNHTEDPVLTRISHIKP